MEGKKKFEKPELQVVELKRPILSGSSGGECYLYPCPGGCHDDHRD